MGVSSMLFGYIGPEVVLPMASALAGVVGFVLMVGRAPFRFAAKVLRSLAKGARSVAKGGKGPGM